MREHRILLYGANGYTGTLVAEEAARRGHRPLLVGRSEEKVRPLADRLGLPWLAVDLGDERALRAAVATADLVFHAAGPFVHTSAPMLEACLASGAHYVDVTGEIPVFEHTLSLDARAKAAGVTLISGVGFDVIPTDCMARFVADAVPGASKLELAIDGGGQPSAGTTKSVLEMLPKGNLVRRHGELVEVPLGHDPRTIRFPHGERQVMAIPWGDLVTAHRTTGIGDITTYMAAPRSQARALSVFGGPLRVALGMGPVRRFAQKLVEKTVQGPDASQREAGRSYVWARAENAKGESKEAWLESLEGYRFTAVGGVRSAERILEGVGTGALTPALAFGADFVLEIEGTRRYESLP
jgi:short subunit dehydrogenase-like uncharacterized protein